MKRINYFGLLAIVLAIGTLLLATGCSNSTEQEEKEPITINIALGGGTAKKAWNGFNTDNIIHTITFIAGDGTEQVKTKTGTTGTVSFTANNGDFCEVEVVGKLNDTLVSIGYWEGTITANSQTITIMMGPPPLTSIADVTTYLTGKSGTVYLAVAIDLGTMATGTEPTISATGVWLQLLTAIDNWSPTAGSGPYIALDLSLCTMTGTVFNPGRSTATGKAKIVSLVLPDAAKSIASGSSCGCTVSGDSCTGKHATFLSFNNLKSISGAEITNTGERLFYPLGKDESPFILESVSFPKVTDIVDNAFNGCTSLTTVSFSEATTSIGFSAFYGCTSLTSVSFPEATSIDMFAFQNCTGLTSVSFPEATSIGSSAFEGCTSLTGLTEESFPNVTTIEANAFSGCTGLESVYFPKATTIGQFAFQGCTGLTSVEFPKVETIGSFAFFDFSDVTNSCNNLASVKLPAGVNIDPSPVFPGILNFRTVYDNGGKLAGTYVPTAPRTGNGSDNMTVTWMRQE